ncbi:MAG: DJ-1/PfpI family protein [Treponema sp.]|nr:DJ-1/PfpI family protein [Treponema sp.]
MDINFLFFEKYETLDIFGPIEILARIDGVNTHYVSVQGGAIKSRQGFKIQTTALSAAKQNGILVIPGGQGTRTLVNDEHFLTELKIACENAEYVLSICTGSALLAKAGVLNGRKATSNKKAFDWVKSVSQDVNWIRAARWVNDGKYYTSSGVSAGMDMALGFVKDLFGMEKAVQISKEIEYIWNIESNSDLF